MESGRKKETKVEFSLSVPENVGGRRPDSARHSLRLASVVRLNRERKKRIFFIQIQCSSGAAAGRLSAVRQPAGSKRALRRLVA